MVDIYLLEEVAQFNSMQILNINNQIPSQLVSSSRKVELRWNSTIFSVFFVQSSATEWKRWKKTTWFKETSFLKLHQ